MTDSVDKFTEGPIDPRIYTELATDMWREAVSYLPIRDVLKLPGLCKYFNEEVVWHSHSGRLLWGEMNLEEKIFKAWPGDVKPPSRTVLMRACREGAKISHITTLLVGGANLNTVNNLGETALHSASDSGHENIVRALLEAKSDPNFAATDRKTPLMYASSRGRSTSVLALIKGGANVNQGGEFGMTALLWASLNDQKEVVRILLKARADVNLRDNFGHTAIDTARIHGSHRIVRILKKEIEKEKSKRI